MKSKVYTETFFLLEGTNRKSGEIEHLAISFDRQALFDFTLEFVENNNDYDGLCITRCGNILQQPDHIQTHPSIPTGVN